MADPSNLYQRLPGWGYRQQAGWLVTVRRASSRLWLGPDHLLCAERAYCIEEYKRFYYRDIQAITLRRTKTASTISAFLATLAVFCAIFALLGGPVWGWVWGITDAALLFFLVINLLKGPTCRTHLKTAVQLEELPAWGRLRRAERGIALLRERVLAAQGSVEAGEARFQLQQMIHPPAPPSPADPAQTSHSTPAGPVAAAHPPAAEPYRGRAHFVLFSLLLAQGAVSLARIPWNSLPLVILDAVVSTAGMGWVLFALIRQHHTDLRPALRQLTWMAAGATALVLVESYVSRIIYMTNHPGAVALEWEFWKGLADVNPLADAQAFWVLALRGLLFAALGGAGLLLKPRRASLARPLLPPAST